MNLYWRSRVPSNLSPIYQMITNKFIYRVLRHIYCRFISLSLICATQFLHALCKSLWKISQISIIVSQSRSLMMVHIWFSCIVFVLNVLLTFQTLHVFQNLFKKKPMVHYTSTFIKFASKNLTSSIIWPRTLES